ncbi:MAG: hypothetical protein MUE34_16990 [Acidimicrobiales bacterium]|jgi:hypothetical protein|nr:hypothetical protein [Acidimicrobiales bacterium]
MRFVRVGLAVVLLVGFAGSACGGDEDAGIVGSPSSTALQVPAAPGDPRGKVDWLLSSWLALFGPDDGSQRFVDLAKGVLDRKLR